jgi:TolA-binding protein
MDPDILGGMAALLGLMVPILGLSFVGLVVFTRSQLGEAVARRIAGGRYDPETDEQISVLQEEVAVLRHQLQETQEQVEFAERLLSRGDRAEPLPR